MVMVALCYWDAVLQQKIRKLVQMNSKTNDSKYKAEILE